MKKVLVLAVFVCSTLLSGVSQAQINTPQPSPGASLTQKVGLTDVTVNYSRPSAKGRKIFGDLLPYGKLWRTGANGATKLTFSDEIMLDGKKIPAGEYSLFTIPGITDWTVILNNNAKAGVNDYKQEEDVVRFTVKPIALLTKVETFTIQVSDLAPNSSAYLDLMWEKTLVRIKIAADVDSKVMAQIKEQIIDGTPKDSSAYFQAAAYYYEANKDLNQALTWVNKVTAKDPKFWMLHLKAKIQAKLRDTKGAIASAKQSIELAKAAKNDDYVALNEKLIAKLTAKK
ncbi:MAG: DUF2911 domain-containing protein [Bacteroidota bacterium]